MWYVYILRCSDGTLYTGITNDWKRRLAAHQSGRGAKYTRGRLPVELVYLMPVGNRSAASKMECALKRMKRWSKLALAKISEPVRSAASG